MSALDNTVHIPVNLNQPAFRLGGHQSIVNTARWHPVMPRIATCGIESKVMLHEPYGSLTGSIKVDSGRVRRRMGSLVGRRRRAENEARARGLESVIGEASEEISASEDKSTILYFDE